jgi:hypothetical protein
MPSRRLQDTGLSALGACLATGPNAASATADFNLFSTSAKDGAWHEAEGDAAHEAWEEHYDTEVQSRYWYVCMQPVARNCLRDAKRDCFTHVVFPPDQQIGTTVRPGSRVGYHRRPTIGGKHRWAATPSLHPPRLPPPSRPLALLASRGRARCRAVVETVTVAGQNMWIRAAATRIGITLRWASHHGSALTPIRNRSRATRNRRRQTFMAAVSCYARAPHRRSLAAFQAAAAVASRGVRGARRRRSRGASVLRSLPR